jgi:hypothetical protein
MMFRSVALALTLCLATITAQAALLGRAPLTPGGTDYQAVYDTDLNITWLADANYAATNTFGVDGIGIYRAGFGPGRPGSMDTQTAFDWLAAMNEANYLGANDWRLPMTVQPDATCSDQYFPIGLPQESLGRNCSGSELGHLYYTELGGVPNSGSVPSAGLFRNIQLSAFWSGTPYPQAQWFIFSFNTGRQFFGTGDNPLFGWGVRSGDIAAVPIPTTAWLLGTALAGLGGRRMLRRKVIV